MCFQVLLQFSQAIRTLPTLVTDESSPKIQIYFYSMQTNDKYAPHPPTQAFVCHFFFRHFE